MTGIEPRPEGGPVTNFLMSMLKLGGPGLVLAIISGLFYLGVQTAESRSRISEALPAAVYYADRRADSTERFYRRRDNEQRFARQDTALTEISGRLDTMTKLLRRAVCRQDPVNCP